MACLSGRDVVTVVHTTKAGAEAGELLQRDRLSFADPKSAFGYLAEPELVGENP
jgi:hypothetical protein